MPTSNPWILHLQKVWKTEKPKGRSYKATMILARKSYRKGGKGAAAEADSSAPKKRRRRRAKKKAQ